MIKGCNRRMIMVKDTGSKYFESAYFIVRCDIPGSCGESDMLSEASRMIEAYSSVNAGFMPKMQKKPRSILPALAAVGCTVLVIGAALLALLL